MSVVFETLFLVAAFQAFIYATIQAHRIHQGLQETDVWFWVQLATGIAAAIPLLHLLQLVCHSGVCPVLLPLLARVELSLILTVMIFTFTTVYHIKKDTEAGNYPF